jgi:hypothetical protein
MIHIDRTRALEPLEPTSLVDRRRNARNVPDRAINDHRAESTNYGDVSPAGSQPSANRHVDLNPALDITTSVYTARPTEKLRCETTRYDPRRHQRGSHRARPRWIGVSSVSRRRSRPVILLRRFSNDAGVPLGQVAIAESMRESFTVNESSTGSSTASSFPGRG